MNKKTRAKIFSVLLALALWQLVSMAVGSEMLLASPVSVVSRLAVIWREPGFLASVLFSFSHIVAGFLLAFIVIYAVVMLLVNLLDHVFRFPVLRMFDWLLGGLCGLVRGFVVAVLLLAVVPAVVSLISPDLMGNLLEGSKLYGIVQQFDFLNVAGVIKSLIR